MKKLIALAFITSFLLSASPVFAQIKPQKLVDTSCLEGGSRQVATLDCFPIIVGNIIFWLLLFAGIVALVFIILSGFKFVFSGGDPKQAEGARKTLTWAVIGLVVILLSFGIIGIIGQTTGVTCIKWLSFDRCVPDDISYACGPGHSNGFCPGKQKCSQVSRPTERPRFECKLVCGQEHGWCPIGQRCLRAGSRFTCRD